MLPVGLIFGFALFFFFAELIKPGRVFPVTQGWYARAIFLNACQLFIVILAGMTWNKWLQAWSIFSIKNINPVAQGFIGWLVGTFVFYWWHRARHKSPILWRLLHQIHHSPTRIETLTAFYKHPLEIASDSLLSSILMFVLLGSSTIGAIWFNVFAAIGEYFYHANLKTPHWVGYIIQRPEHHSIHHQLDVHNYNFGDLPIWDRLFGTFKDTKDFAPICGFPTGKELALGKMLRFKDNYN